MEDSAGEAAPKLLGKEGRCRSENAVDEIDEDSSQSCSDGEEEEIYLNRPWKKFGKCPRFLETVELHRSSPFYFHKRQGRIDWRTLHAINVDTVIQEIDICKLETVLDTITFGDIQGEDTRNFTEHNFIKLFRLAQLMIEYLLHVQGVLAEQKTQLISTGAIVQRRGEKLRLRCLWQRDALRQCQRDLKHARKTLKTYEILLRSNGKAAPAPVQQVHHCPCCDKVFESSFYLDLHVSKRHKRSSSDRTEKPERRRYHSPERVDRAVETTSTLRSDSKKSVEQVRAETEAILQAEFDRVHSSRTATHNESSSSDCEAINSLRRALCESNNRLDWAEQQLGQLQSEIPLAQKSKQKERCEDEYSGGGRLRILEEKVTCVEGDLRNIHKENIKLRTELDVAYRELSSLRSQRPPKMTDYQGRAEIDECLERQVRHHTAEIDECLERQVRHHKKKHQTRCEDTAEDEFSDEDFTNAAHAKNLLAVREWISETDERFSELNMGVSDNECSTPRSHHSYHSHQSHHSHRSEPVSPTIRQLMDAEDQSIGSDKERWLKERPHAPISDKPYALSKYPHDTSTVHSMQEKLTEKFDSRLNDELQKFGISSNAKGISDETFSAAIATLERQRMCRYRESPVHDRRVMEYERSTIQWHIERAVKSRDMEKLESIFEEETESKCEDSAFDNFDPCDPCSDPCGTADSRRSRGRQTPPRIPDPCSDPRSDPCFDPCSEPCSDPCSPTPPRTTKGFTEHTTRGCTETKGFTEQFVSKEFSWADECESQTFQVTGQVIAQRVKSPEGHRFVISPVTSPTGGTRMHHIYEEERIEEEFGLGDWESQEGKLNARSPEIQRQVMRDIQSRMGSPSSDRAATRPTAKQKGKQPAGNRTKHGASSSNEDIKMLDELDAEIDELIKG